MSHINVEIKALCDDPSRIRAILLADKECVSKGTDHQVDTYFAQAKGRLKIREGTIENSIIHYERSDQSGPKRSDVTMMRAEPEQMATLKKVLMAAYGSKVVVDKQREIYFVGNVKFHIDCVEKLGNFVEIEAIDVDGTRTEETLLQQCNEWLKKLDIKQDQLLENSYSDQLLASS